MSSDTAPLITILVPTYNRLGSLKNLVSWLERNAFNHPEVSILISNNASTDDTRAYLEGYAQISNLRINHMHSNCGALIHIGWLYAQPTSSYVWMICDDDLPTDDALEQVLSSLKKYRDLVWLYLPFVFTDDAGISLSSSFCPPRVLVTDKGESLFAELAGWCSLISANVLLTRKIQKHLSSCDAGNAFYPLWLFLQSSKDGKSMVLDRALLSARAKVSNDGGSEKIMINDLIRAVTTVDGVSDAVKAEALIRYFPRDPFNFIRAPFVYTKGSIWLFSSSPFKVTKLYIKSVFRVYYFRLMPTQIRLKVKKFKNRITSASSSLK
jgi:glycosyltransferase involved in cell wall biosynthesis